MSMDMTVSDSTVPDSCVTDPTQANCTDYAYPEANAVSAAASPATTAAC